jgi:hypothetical protein
LLPSFLPFGFWPCGFLLSALPTQPAQGFPLASPLPLPFSDGLPSVVEQYGPPGHWPFAPPSFESALLIGCGPTVPPDETPALPEDVVPDVVPDVLVDASDELSLDSCALPFS